MKKKISSLVIVMSLIAIPEAVRASWSSDSKGGEGFLSLWADEDEEDAISKNSSSRKSSETRRQRSISRSNEIANDGYNATMNSSNSQGSSEYYSTSSDDSSVNQQRKKITTTKQIRRIRTVDDSSSVYANNAAYTSQQAPLYFVPSDDTENYNIDYDTLQAEHNANYEEVANSIEKWKNGGTNVFWENYRGNNIRIEMLRNNRDLKEMRLKFVQSQSMTSDPDGSISDILNVVADRVMKRTCGKKSKQSVILYERPSVELERETSADNYKVMAKGTSLKEYGFRCVY